jgi:cell division protein FtsB
MYKALGILGGVALLGAAGYAVYKSKSEDRAATEELNAALLAQMRREREALEREVLIEEGIARRTQTTSRNQGFVFEEDSQNTIYGNKRILY